MTSLIVVDESGDLGSKGSRYFVMSAIIILASRELKVISKQITGSSNEQKFYNADEKKVTKLLTDLSKTSVKIAYVVIEKNNPTSNRCLYGNELYKMMLKKLLQ